MISKVKGFTNLVRRWIQISAVIGLVTPVFSQPAITPDTPDFAVLTNALQVLRLTPEQSKSNLTVRIEGLVTCYNLGMLFVQDETAGIFVHHVGDVLPLLAGQFVRVSGSASMGLYSPVIISKSIVRQDSGAAINPLPVSLAEIQQGGLDAQWVEVVGIVRGDTFIGNQLVLDLADGPERLQVWISNARGYGQPGFSGSRVRVRGVVGSRVSAQRQLQGFQIYANSVSDVSVIRPAPVADAPAAPRWQIRDLQNHRARSTETGRVTVRGVVTFNQPGRGMFIQDATGGLELLPQSAPEGLVPGDTVEVTGYPGTISATPRLESAWIRKVEPPMASHAVSVLPGDLSQPQYENQLIELTGNYLGQANLSNVVALSVQAGDYLLSALLDAREFAKVSAELKPGCSLRLTGLCRISRDVPSTVSLLLRSASDLKILAAPPSLRRIEPILLVGVTVLSGVGCVVAWWFIRRERRQTEHVLQLHAALQAEMRQSEQQLRRSVEERERMGRDLHDDIIQSIYAAGLNLEDSRRVLRESPNQAEARLEAAINTLNDTIRGVRGFIAGIEPKVLNGGELKTALKSLALTTADVPTPFQFQVEQSAANVLTSTQATQLLHIAKEAMSNSLRHAHASRVVVSLQNTSEGIQLEIADDGVGFATDSANTGQGLRNMATRAREIGGTLRTISSPGQGCRILVVVPQRNAHEHD